MDFTLVKLALRYCEMDFTHINLALHYCEMNFRPVKMIFHVGLLIRHEIITETKIK